jgi:arylformamidase
MDLRVMNRKAAQRDPLTDYNNQGAVKDFQKFFDQWNSESERFMASAVGFRDVPYGQGPKQTLDIFLPENTPEEGLAPVFIHVHGGWWYFLSKEAQSFVSEPFLDKGCVVACVEYLLAPMGSISDLVRDVRTSVLWIYNNIERFGGDPHRMHIGGQSAGSHLTAMCATADWAALGAPKHILKSYTCVSGLYDLHDCLDIPQNKHIRMLPRDAALNSPIDQLPETSTPMILSVGGREQAGFLRQHEAFKAAWSAPSRPLIEVFLPDDHHYHTVNRMAEKHGPLTKKMLEQIFPVVESRSAAMSPFGGT